jgi:hypothetical protein
LAGSEEPFSQFFEGALGAITQAIQRTLAALLAQRQPGIQAAAAFGIEL